ncbi:protein telomere ends associated isoform X2 [Drosophila grimshawi]|uniref:protein telomere ends associated isoform X2 n=1 Tax=Drosophila grimshawi TaxID=7222 RepID=UPI001C935DA6|nr:protein telomere ends associated isoform X2 [Drosophila grimshawi]
MTSVRKKKKHKCDSRASAQLRKWLTTPKSTKSAPFPVTFKMFSNVVENLPDIAFQIQCAEIGATNKTLDECAQWYYNAFYSEPAVRSKYEFRLRSCPLTVKEKLLQLPDGVVPADIEKDTEQLETEDGVVVKVNRFGRFLFPVSLATFEQNIDRKMVLDYLVRKETDNVKQRAVMLSDEATCRKLVRKYYNAFYIFRNQHNLDKRNFKEAPAALKTQLLKMGSPLDEQAVETLRKKSEKKQGKTTKELPQTTSQPSSLKSIVSYVVFEKYITNIYDIVFRLKVNEPEYAYKGFEECAHAYYLSFYLTPEIRDTYPYQLAGCTTRLRNLILALPSEEDARILRQMQMQSEPLPAAIQHQVEDQVDDADVDRQPTDIVQLEDPPNIQQATQIVLSEMVDQPAVDCEKQLSPEIEIVAATDEQASLPVTPPVTFKVFQRFVKNLDEIAQQMLRSEEYQGKSKDECALEYFQQFYANPQIRVRFEYELRACPAKMRKKLLSLPAKVVVSSDKIMDAEKDCNDNQTSLPSERNLITINGITYEYPVSLETFLRYINYDELKTQIVKTLDKQTGKPAGSSSCDDQFIKRFYYTFYLDDRLHQKFKNHFNAAPAEIREKLTQLAIAVGSEEQQETNNVLKTSTELALEQTPGKATEKATEETPEQAPKHAPEQPPEQATEEKSEQPPDSALEQGLEQAPAQQPELATEEKSEQPPDNALEQEFEQQPEQAAEQAPEQAAEQAAEQAETEKNCDVEMPEMISSGCVFDVVMDLGNAGRYMFPVSFETFERCINYGELIRPLLMRVTEDESQLAAMVPNSRHPQCQKIFRRYYRSFYVRPIVRTQYEYRFANVSEQLLSKLLAFAVPLNEIAKKHVDEAAREMAQKVNEEEDQLFKTFPVSYKAFKNCFTNLNGIVQQMMNCAEYKDKSEDECALEYYKAFYTDPQMREKFEYKLKPCPATLRIKLLKMPEVAAAPTQQQAECESQPQREEPVKEVTEIPTTNMDMLVQSERILITLKDITYEFPVSFQTFTRCINYDSVRVELANTLSTDKRDDEHILENERSDLRMLRRFYHSFYTDRRARHLCNYNFDAAPVDLQQKLLQLAIPLARQSDNKASSVAVTECALALPQDSLAVTEPPRVEQLAAVAQSQPKTAIQYPLSYNIFSKLLKLDEVVKQMQLEPQYAQMNEDDCKLAYFDAFYRTPQIRDKYRCMMNPCPAALKSRLLEVPQQKPRRDPAAVKLKTRQALYAARKAELAKMEKLNVVRYTPHNLSTYIARRIKCPRICGLLEKHFVGTKKQQLVKESTERNATAAEGLKDNQVKATTENETVADALATCAEEIGEAVAKCTSTTTTAIIATNIAAATTVASVASKADNITAATGNTAATVAKSATTTAATVTTTVSTTATVATRDSTTPATETTTASTTAAATVSTATTSTGNTAATVAKSAPTAAATVTKIVSTTAAATASTATTTGNTAATVAKSAPTAAATVTKIVSTTAAATASTATTTGNTAATVAKSAPTTAATVTKTVISTATVETRASTTPATATSTASTTATITGNTVVTVAKKELSTTAASTTTTTVNSTTTISSATTTASKATATTTETTAVTRTSEQLLNLLMEEGSKASTASLATTSLNDATASAFFKDSSKEHNLKYLICTSYGLKNTIWRILSSLSYKEFELYTSIYEDTSFYKDASILGKCYNHVLSKGNWPINLHVKLQKLPQLLHSKGIRLESFDLGQLSPKMLHWTELVRFSNFYEIVEQEFKARTGQDIEDMQELHNEIVEHYTLCWAHDHWLYQVPQITAEELTQSLNAMQQVPIEFSEPPSTMPLCMIEDCIGSSGEVVANSPEQNPTELPPPNAVLEDSNNCPATQLDASLCPPCFVNMDSICPASQAADPQNDPLNQSHTQPAIVIKKEPVKLLNMMRFSPSSNVSGEFNCELIASEDQIINIDNDEDQQITADLACFSMPNSPPVEGLSQPQDIIQELFLELLPTVPYSEIKWHSPNPPWTPSVAGQPSLTSVAVQQQAEPIPASAPVQPQAEPIPALAPVQPTAEPAPAPAPIRTVLGKQKATAAATTVPRKKLRLMTDNVPQLRHEFRPLPLIAMVRIEPDGFAAHANKKMSTQELPTGSNRVNQEPQGSAAPTNNELPTYQQLQELSPSSNQGSEDQPAMTASQALSTDNTLLASSQLQNLLDAPFVSQRKKR